MPLLELGEGVLNPLERVGGRDRDLEPAVGCQLGERDHDLGRRARGAALGVRADLGRALERDDRVDPLRWNSERECEVDVLGTEGVDERVNAAGAAARIRAPGRRRSSPGSRRAASSQAWLSCDAMPMTLAPRMRSSCTAIEPTPPAAAETTTVSPGCGSTAATAAQAVAPATFSDPATSQLRPSGLGTSWVTGTVTYSAWLERRQDQPSTSSPGANPLTPSPTAVTTPARSVPSPGRERRREALVQQALADARLAGVDRGGANLDERLAGGGLRESPRLRRRARRDLRTDRT